MGEMHLVIGHAASGKSAWAERLAAQTGAPLTYIATARLWDDEMRAKRDAHAARRGAEWTLIEEPLDLPRACAGLDATVLIDCATMWLTNHLMDETDWRAQCTSWLTAMRWALADFIIVTNDVGGGVTPDNAMARQFQRDQGALNQMLAAKADRVTQVIAGLPQTLK